MGDRLSFDAGALVDIVLGEEGEVGGSPSCSTSTIVDLATYEAANALWKTAFDRISRRILTSRTRSTYSNASKVRFESATELARTIQVARRDGLSFYGTSYLAIADRDDLAPVIEDGAL